MYNSIGSSYQEKTLRENEKIKTARDKLKEKNELTDKYINKESKELKIK